MGKRGSPPKSSLYSGGADAGEKAIPIFVFHDSNLLVGKNDKGQPSITTGLPRRSTSYSSHSPAVLRETRQLCEVLLYFYYIEGIVLCQRKKPQNIMSISSFS